MKLVKHITKQLLEGLRFLDHKEIIHCDLKPENILLSDPDRGMVKIIDFGSSCYESEKVYTYIQSRFYRSPEVILGMVYNQRIDMWSLGCIIAELLTGHPLFMGENEQEQIACIMEIFGVPEKSMISQCSRRKLFFDSVGNPRMHVSSKNVKRYPGTKSLKKVLKTNNDLLVDFLSQCLIWNPRNRLGPSGGLRHEFISGISAHDQARGLGSRKASYSSLISVNSNNFPIHEPNNPMNIPTSIPHHASTGAGYVPTQKTQQYNIKPISSESSQSSQSSQSSKSSTNYPDQTRPLPNIPTGRQPRQEPTSLMIPKTSGEFPRPLPLPKNNSGTNVSKYGSMARHPSGPRPLAAPPSSIEATAYRSMSGVNNSTTFPSGQHDNPNTNRRSSHHYTVLNNFKNPGELPKNPTSFSSTSSSGQSLALKPSKSSSSLLSASSSGSSVIHAGNLHQAVPSQKCYRNNSNGSAISNSTTG